MKHRQNTWALVLAAGDGARLASLTTNRHGFAVPKQFCSLNGGESLLQESLQRAQQIVLHRRVCVVVAQSHETYWRPELWSLAPANIIVQPRNCGTANGILLGVLRILSRDPRARIVLLPSDHYVLDENLLSNTLRTAVALLSRGRKGFLLKHLLLIGIAPDEADPEFGYIIPGGPIADRVSRVTQFVEKPTATVARDLIARGAVCNSFILAAHGTTLVASIRERYPKIVEDMSAAVARDTSRSSAQELATVYKDLPNIDFSRSILQGAESSLWLLSAPACGWTDLGTPRRVETALRRLWSWPRRRLILGTRNVPATLNLATQYERCRDKLRTVAVVGAKFGEESIAL
jgi:mannose-1-phosphate guanylyltransferase